MPSAFILSRKFGRLFLTAAPSLEFGAQFIIELNNLDLFLSANRSNLTR